MILRIRRHFDAAHKLTSYEGDCQNLHGHRWEVVVDFEGEIDSGTNMTVDFKQLKSLVDDILPDHKYLNDYFMEDDPTAEYLVWQIQESIDCVLETQQLPVRLVRIEVFESPDCSVILEGRKCCTK